MAYNYNWNCQPCGRTSYSGGRGMNRPPYPGPWGPPPPPDRTPYPGAGGPGPGRPPYPGAGGLGPGRPPYPGPGGPGPGRPPYPGAGGPGPGRPPYLGPWGPPPGSNRRMQSQSYTPESEEMDDLYMTDMREPERMEEDWLYMKQLYPNTARKLLRYIEDAADKLEYENSLMFDAYPDRIAVEQVVKEIIAVIQENEPALLEMRENEETSRQENSSEQNANQTWDICIEEMIQVMLLAEMHHRRWRYEQMSRRNY